jgi:cystathionine beta-lyase/cystathionine gamma-synthase
LGVERAKRTIRWEPAGPYLRLHVGLESVDGLIADLEDEFARLRG